MPYTPQPLDTSRVDVPLELSELTEQLARNTHEHWARRRMNAGWRYGPRRDDAKKEHPGLVPYEQLTEPEKDFDRQISMETLKTILSLGFRIAR